MSKLIKSGKKLTKLEQEFVNGLLLSGGNLSQAMSYTSYQGKNPSAQASQYWFRSHVKEAYKQAIWDKLGRSAGAAVNSLIQLAQEADSEHAKLAAANAILDRVGFKQAETLNINGQVTVNLDLGNKKPSDTGATQLPSDDGQVIDITPDNEGTSDVDVS